MNTIDSLFEAYKRGENPVVPPHLRKRYDALVADHLAIEAAFAALCPSPRPEAQGPLPKLPPPYKAIRELGRGAAGVVYLAQDLRLKRPVAVKVLRAEAVGDMKALPRFVDEARLLASLRHASLVRVFACGRAEGRPFFVMDYIEGESLEQRLQRGPLPYREAVWVLSQVASAVARAHERGIVHRDLKPANVLLDRSGHAWVTDFGIARDVRRPSELTATGEPIGTPAYMSPEQANAQKRKIGPATDVHALGTLLYEMLTGHLPFVGETLTDVLNEVCTAEPLPPRRLVPTIPRDLETICLKCLAKAPWQRYATAGALLDDLRRLAKGEPIQARPAGAARRALHRCRRHPWLAAAGALLAVALTAWVAMPAWRYWQDRRAVARAEEAGAALQADGRFLDALDRYEEGYARATEAEKERLSGRMVTCAGNLEDTAPGAVAWQRLVAHASGESLPRQAYQVWQERQDRAAVAKAIEAGEALLATGKPKEALDACEAPIARANDAEKGRILAEMAACAGVLEERGEGASAWERILRRAPGTSVAHQTYEDWVNRLEVAKAIAEGLRLQRNAQYLDEMDVYERAYPRADAEEKDGLICRMSNDAVALGTDERGLAAWKRVLALAPGRSFGVFDRYVAQAYLRDLRRRYDGRLMTAAEKEPEAARATIERIQLFLKQDPVMGDEREDAKGAVDLLEAALHPEEEPPSQVEAAPDPGAPSGPGAAQVVAEPAAPSTPAAPEGGESAAPRVEPPPPTSQKADPQEGTRKAHGPEKAGDKARTLATVRKTWKEICSVCPVASYTADEGDMEEGYWKPKWVEHTQGFEALADAHQVLRRLAPSEPDPLTGGIVLHAPQGLPKGYDFQSVRIDLWTDDAADPSKRPGRAMIRPAFHDGVARVRVADGTYHLLVGDPLAVIGLAGGGRDLRFDFAGMPREVKVRGNWVDVPAPRVVKVQETRLLAPAAEARVDLTTEVFRWQRVPGAERYVLRLEGKVSDRLGERTWLVMAPVDGTSVCLGAIAANSLAGDVGDLVSKRVASWSVDAYGSDGQVVGSPGSPRRLVISHGLGGR